MATAAASTTTSNRTSLLTSAEGRWPFVNGAGPLQELLPGYKIMPAVDTSPAYAIFDQPIETSPNDDREYRYIASLAAEVARRP